MRKLITILLSFIFIMGLIAGDKSKSIISVKGMKDKSCVEKLTKALNSTEGIENVIVELESGQVTIEHKGVDFALIEDAIAKTLHEKSKKNHSVEAEEKSCSEAEKAGCSKPCGRKDD